MNAYLDYIKLAAVALVIGLASWFFYNAGANSVRADYAKRDAKAASDNAAALKQANAERDASIAKHTELQSQASAAYQVLIKERDDADEKLAHAVAAGTRKLYVLAKCPTAANVSSTTQAATDPSGAIAPVAVELATGTSDDLVRYGRRINKLQAEYNRCYAELENDRK